MIFSEAGLCLEADPGAPSRQARSARITECREGDIRQRWAIQGLELRSVLAKDCLEVYEPDQFRDGGRVQLSPCNGSISQQWRLFGSQIRSGGTGKCLNARDPFKPGVSVDVWDCDGSVGQAWNVKPR